MKPNRCNHLLRRLLGFFLIPSLTVTLHAAGVWDGGDTSANWSAPLNWDNDAVPVSPLALSFGGSVRLANTNDLTGFTASGITFNVGAGAFLISGNPISLAGNVVNSGTSLATIGNNLALTADRTVNSATGDIALSGNVTGAFALIKTGTGKLTLSGTGGTNRLEIGSGVTGGTVELSGGAWTHSATSTGLIVGNGTNGTGALIVSGGTHSFGGDNYGNSVRVGTAVGTTGTNGTLNVTGGTLNIGNASAPGASMNLGTSMNSGTSNGTLNVSGGTLNMFGGRILVGANSATNTAVLTLSGTGAINLGVGGADGDRGRLRLGSGGTTVNLDGGTLSLKDIYVAESVGTTSSIYFNGTTLKAAAATTDFISGAFSNTAAAGANLLIKNGGLIFDTNGFDVTIADTINQAPGQVGSFTKNGSGILTFTGGSDRTGATVVNAGTLAFGAGALSPGAVTVAGAGTLRLGGTGVKTISSLTLADGATVSGLAGVPAAGTSTTVTNTLAFNGGTNTIGVGSLASQPTLGAVYDVLRAGAITGTATLHADFGGASRLSGTMAIVGNKVQLTVTSPSASLVWNNSTADGLWNLDTSANFTNVSANDVFKQYDSVTFSDAPVSGEKTVTLGTAALLPSALTVNNSDGDYILTGGTINGPAALTKSGSSTLTINGTHGFTGGVTVNGGTFISATSRSLGAINNNVVVNNPGSTIRFNAHDSFGQASAVPTNTVTANNGAIITNGNSYTTFGTLNLNSSSLIANGGASAAYQAFKLVGPVNVTGASTIGVSSTPGNAFTEVHLGANVADVQTPFNVIGAEDSLTVSAVIRNAVTGTGGAAVVAGLIKNGAGTMQFTNTNTYAGVTTIDGGTLVVGDGATSGSLGTGAVVNNAKLVFNRSDERTIAAAISGVGTLRQAGAGTTILTGANTYTGNTEVVTGTLKINTAMLADGADVAVASGGVLHLNFAGEDEVDGFYINGVPQATGTWGGVGSGATHITVRITGTGILKVNTLDPYDVWAIDQGLTGGNIGKGLDPDDDGMNNLGEYAFDDTPMFAGASGKMVTKVADLNGQKVLTLTLPVRENTLFPTEGQIDALISTRKDGLTYRIEGSDSLGSFSLLISELNTADSTAVRSGMNLPNPTAGWTYRTFRTPGAVGTASKQFIRAKATDAP